eukprot:TRINITY_DN14859_c0_g1_i1.p1 TRINITY_DN14859_c0_g1~~TRINITY_DN14859_c0_g1_i1.p1  ORF type:complete len:460 (-),score=138.63 TRINITY_DN14859_c0_g1_i1:12-1334(-)
MSNTMKCTKLQVLRYILNKQGLIDRQKYSARNVSRLGVLHSTLQTTPFLSLLGRTHRFDADHFRTNLCVKAHPEAAFARLRCMRGTLHLVPPDIAPVIRALLRARHEAVLKRYQVPPKVAQRALPEITKVLKRHGPQTTVLVKKLLKEKVVEKFAADGHGDLLRWVRPVLQWGIACGSVDYGQSGSASWRKADQKFSHGEELEEPEEEEEEEDYHHKLLQWYMKTYGPATLEDFEWWCGGSACGWNKTKVRNAFEKIQHELEQVTVKGCFGRFYIHTSCKGDLEKEHKSTPIKMARFLPYEDALLKAYKPTRNRFYCEENFEKIVEKSGEAKPTVWLNGTVIGYWEWKNKPNCDMVVHLREKTDEIVEELQEEAERVRTFIQAKKIVYKQIPDSDKKTAKKRKSAPPKESSTSSSSSSSSYSSSSSSSEEDPKKKKRKTF